MAPCAGKCTEAEYREMMTGVIHFLEGDYRPVVDQLKAEMAEAAADEPGEWKALRFAIVPDPCNSNYNGTTYIDTMSRKATDKFIEMTHEEYAKRCGDRLGRSIKGIFTDEPQYYRWGSTYSNTLPPDFVFLYCLQDGYGLDPTLNCTVVMDA